MLAAVHRAAGNHFTSHRSVQNTSLALARNQQVNNDAAVACHVQQHGSSTLWSAQDNRRHLPTAQNSPEHTPGNQHRTTTRRTHTQQTTRQARFLDNSWATDKFNNEGALACHVSRHDSSTRWSAQGSPQQLPTSHHSLEHTNQHRTASKRNYSQPTTTSSKARTPWDDAGRKGE